MPRYFSKELHETLAESTNAVARLDVPLHIIPDLYRPTDEGSPHFEWLATLLGAIRKEPSLSVFDGVLHGIGGSASRQTHESLATWLLRRSREVGPDEALDNIREYLESSDFEAKVFVAVGGLSIESDIELDSEFRLISWKGVPESSARASIDQYGLLGILDRPSVALVSTRRFPKEIHLPGVAGFGAASHTAEADAILVLSVIRPVAPIATAFWIEAPANVPVYGGGISMPHVDGTLFPRAAPVDFSERARSLTRKWKALPEARRAELRVPLSRLNSAVRRSQPVDSAIDLGIALEALLLNDLDDERGEFAFRIRVRAARWMGASAEERRELSSLMRDLYSARSVAVHTGRLAPKLGKKSTADLLQEGYDFVAAAISRIIETGPVDWQAVVLS